MSPISPNQAAASGWLVVCLGLVFFVPGLVALRAAGLRARGIERLGLAAGVSITLWPLALLWTSVLGFTWSPARYRILMLVLVAIACAPFLRRTRANGSWKGRLAELPRPAPWILALAGILLIAAVLRVVQVAGVVAPPWVDGYHHTLITQLVVERGAVPADYRPYLAVDRFYYHFGFHALAAAVAWLSGAGVVAAVLATGQALNVLTVLTVFVLARRLLESPISAVLAAAVPAALYWFPSYFVTWGRYTQLAGLVALPVVWILVADAIAARRPVRGQLLAAACAAGLLLVHYRVFAFYLIGIGLVAVYVVGARRQPRERLMRLLAIGVAGGVLVLPWLARNLAGGVAALASASPTWYRGPAETVEAVSQVPDWLFTQGSNGLWIRLAIVGTLLGLARRRPAAFGLAAWMALAYLAVRPGWLGLSTSWMLPPFSLVISLYIPVAIGVGLLADALAAIVGKAVAAARREAAPGDAATIQATEEGVNPIDIGGRRNTGAPDDVDGTVYNKDRGGTDLGGDVQGSAATGRTVSGSDDSGADAGPALRRRLGDAWGRYVAAIAALAVLGLGLAGASQLRSVINPATIIVQAADVAAADWIRGHSPPDARFLVSTTHWHLGTYRGLDGGYWLPILAGRATTMPAALYTYGDPAEVRAATAIAETAAKGDGLSDTEIDALLERTGADYVYVGPTAAGQPGKLSAERLRRHSGLVERYGRNGAFVFERREKPVP